MHAFSISAAPPPPLAFAPPCLGRLCRPGTTLPRYHRVGAAAALRQPRDDDTATAFNIGKVILGAGGFALPWAFAKCGAGGALVAIAACSTVGSYTVQELFAAKRAVEAATADESKAPGSPIGATGMAGGPSESARCHLSSTNPG